MIEATPEDRFAKVVNALHDNGDVVLGSGKKSFGASTLQINGKIFAMLCYGERFVVKLSRQRVDSLVTSGNGERFDPGHGRLMKEWLEVEPASDEDWLALAREAMEFVASKR